MELGGNEKRIQALFLELKLEDERASPGFDKVWNRAQVTTPSHGHAFKVSFALATIVIVIALSSLVLWWRNRDRGLQSNPILAGQPARSSSTPSQATAILEPKQVGVVEGVVKVNGGRPNRFVRKRAARQSEIVALRQAEMRNVMSISSWQSPTATLMLSPAEDVWTSLPQLDRGVSALKSFLPNTPE